MIRRRFSCMYLVLLLALASTVSAERIACWPLNGNTEDIQGDHDNGVLTGGASFVNDAQRGTVLRVDGTGYIRAPHDDDMSFSAADSYTIMAWVYIDAVTGGWQGIMSKSRDQGTHYGIWITDTGEWMAGGWENRGSDVETQVWIHVAYVQDGAASTGITYLNGAVDWSGGPRDGTGLGDFLIGGAIDEGGGQELFGGLIDDVQVFNHALTEEEILAAMQDLVSPALAAKPSPANKVTDVVRDAILSWTPGEFAATHNVYLGTSFDDVNSATVATASNLDVSAFDPGRLDFGLTYFWRVDEVNGTPDKTVFKGEVWSFTAEPYSIQIPGDSIVVTASSFSNQFSVPENTINGSGMGADNMHSIGSEHMWFTAAVDLDPWIQYEFDTVQKLDVMRVWNSNSAAEVAIGWGVKDVEIMYSVDGENWDVLADANQFSRAPGLPTYNTYDSIDFGGAAAKVVRLNIASNWGGMLMSYSLSEVQFEMIPAAARQPVPASGAADVLPNAAVSWRAGRDADQHTIYLSTDQAEVADGLAPSSSSSTNSLDLTPLDLQLDQTYYWRVDEVNDAEVPSVWAGPVWSLSTPAALIVDDFESYTNFSPNRPFQAWLDGFGYSADDFFPVTYGGNGTGAGVGHDIWTPSSPHFDGNLMETNNTIIGSGQSMPFYYSNTGGMTSQTERHFAVPQDWTLGGAKTLSIAFNGQSGNTGTLFVMINNAKVTYQQDGGNISGGTWQVWNIDLTSVNTNLQNITKLVIGVDGSSASGMILIDDIRLYSRDPGNWTQASIITFSQLGDLVGDTEGDMTEDYLPPELQGMGLTMTWTGWAYFSDPDNFENLPDHSSTLDPDVAKYEIYGLADENIITFSRPVEIPSLWFWHLDWGSETEIVGYLGDDAVWQEDLTGYPNHFVAITAGAGHKVDKIVVSGGGSFFDDIAIVE